MPPTSMTPTDPSAPPRRRLLLV
ncbi:MAG: hypothetical protein JWO69_705, partial [Thermoleophilia bacterium]|nr:hypothetical protein [Thermoleophilia bacterium]